MARRGIPRGTNVNAAVMIGAAVAVKKTMEQFDIQGTLRIYGAPAEEQLVSRPYFVRDGYFKDVDVALHDHIGSNLGTVYGLRQYALISAEFTFKGESAHAATSPWTARDALDAVVLMDIGWDKLREHLEAVPAQPPGHHQRRRPAQRHPQHLHHLVVLPRGHRREGTGAVREGQARWPRARPP